MNILLTTQCNLNCRYCFAGALRSSSVPQEMSLGELETILPTLVPGRDPVRLMGGEPTLHGAYATIIPSLKKRGYSVTVFTNGINPILRQTAPYLPDVILLNLNQWESYSSREKAALRSNLSALSERVSLAYTIVEPAFDLSMHRTLILSEALMPVIRLGLAQPVVGGDNTYLPDEDLPAAHQAVVRWAKELGRDSIRLSLDCGFMRCFFSDADMDTLIRAGTVINFVCSPTLDVGPGLKVWRCFAFSAGEGLPWEGFSSESEQVAWFNGQDTVERETCRDCVHHASGWCGGGCLARRVNQVSEGARL